jgi:hypothetical protein
MQSNGRVTLEQHDMRSLVPECAPAYDAHRIEDCPMTAQDGDAILATVVGGRTVREHLDAAIASGTILYDAARDRYRLPASNTRNPFLVRRGIDPGEDGRDCAFLIRFLFHGAYGGTTVPRGCRACYKVKVYSRTMRQMMAVRALSEALPQSTKSGLELNSPARRYATYVYARGLDQARAIHKTIRAGIDADASLGPDTEIVIKRGCSEYEVRCGRSDGYTFDPKLEAVEDYLHARFELGGSESNPTVRLLQIARAAHRIGDETYTGFVGGELPANTAPPPRFRPRPQTLTYSPDADGDGDGAGHE